VIENNLIRNFDVLDVFCGGLEASPAARKSFREAKERQVGISI
jgi:hypothetical protein